MLLTEKQQLFLIHLLERHLTEETQYIYHRTKFRKYVEPLVEYNLVKESDGSIFSLTWKGVIMARFLAGLLNDEKYVRFEKYAII